MKRNITLKIWLVLTCLLVGIGKMWAKDISITENFEEQTAKTTYNDQLTYTADESNIGISWFVEHGCVSTTDKLQGTKSMHMRAYYLSGSSKDKWHGKLPYTETKTAIKGLKSVSFISRVSNTRLTVSCSYSTDGATWIEVKTLSFSDTNTHTSSFDIQNPDSETDYYIKIAVAENSTHADKPKESDSYNFRIDNITFTSFTEDSYVFDADTRAVSFTTTGEVSKADVEKVVAEHPETTSIDLTRATMTGAGVDDIMTLFVGKNVVAITNTTDATADNVIMKNDEGHYSCSKLSLTDKLDFAPGVVFDAAQVTYNRSNTTGYNTVCLPFDIEASAFGSNAKVYKLTGTEIVNKATCITFDETTDAIPAGTPCLVDGGNTEDWALLLSNVKVNNEAMGVEGTPSDENSHPTLHGTYLTELLGEGCYKLNSTGEKFVRTTAESTIMPFRFYLRLGDGSSESKECSLQLSDDVGYASDIYDVQGTHVKSHIFDLNGRRVMRITIPGVYVIKGRKVVR